MNTEEIKVLLEAQQQQIRKLSAQLESIIATQTILKPVKPKKKWLRKSLFTLLLSIFSGGLIGSLLGYVVQTKDIQVKQLDIMRQFLPELAGSEPIPESTLTIFSSSVGKNAGIDKELVVELASLVPKTGGINFLIKLSPPSEFEFESDKAIGKLEKISDNPKLRETVVSSIQASQKAKISDKLDTLLRKITDQDNASLANTPTQKKWVIIFGSDSIREEADDEVSKAKNKFSKIGPVLLYKKGKWFVTTIESESFTTLEKAKDTLEKKVRLVKKDAYLVDLNTWCVGYGTNSKDSNDVYKCS